MYSWIGFYLGSVIQSFLLLFFVCLFVCLAFFLLFIRLIIRFREQGFSSEICVHSDNTLISPKNTFCGKGKMEQEEEKRWKTFRFSPALPSWFQWDPNFFPVCMLRLECTFIWCKLPSSCSLNFLKQSNYQKKFSPTTKTYCWIYITNVDGNKFGTTSVWIL
jgi:hypothetical protein